MKRKIQKLTIGCFLSFLLFFSVLHILLPDTGFSPNENRYLEKMPVFDFSTVVSGKFMSQFTDYVQDQFPFRDMWISLKAASELILNKKVNNGIYVTENALITQFEEVDLNQIKKNTKYINQFSQDLKIPVWVMIVPTIAEIYPENLPKYNLEVSQKELVDMIKGDLNENIHFISLLETLYLHKDEPLYFMTDHHWTMRGAYYGYQAFMQEKGLEQGSLKEYEQKVVSENFKGTSYSSSGVFWHPGDRIEVFTKPEFENVSMEADGKKYDSMFVTENLELKDQYTYFLDGNHALTYLNSAEEEGTLLVIKDSYAHDFAPYLTENYKKVILVDLRYYKLPVSDLIEQEDIDEILILYNIENYAEDTNLMFLE